MYDKNFLTTGIFILFLSFVNIVLYGQNFQQAPVNQDRIQAKSADWNNLGLIPEFFLPHFGKTPSKKALVAFPSVYDLRTAGPGGTSLVTSAKDQGTCGACWAFAAMGSMESYAKKTGRGDYDLSENNLKECHGFVSAACSGGNDNMISSYLARKSGPVAEIYDPYKPAVLGCKENINPEFWVEDIRFLTFQNLFDFDDKGFNRFWFWYAIKPLYTIEGPTVFFRISLKTPDFNNSICVLDLTAENGPYFKDILPIYPLISWDEIKIHKNWIKLIKLSKLWVNTFNYGLLKYKNEY